MRGNQEDTSAFNTHFQSGRFSHSRKVLTSDVFITFNGSLVNFFVASGADRNAYLPELEDGRFFVVSNVGATNLVVVRDSLGVLKTTLLPNDTALLFASKNEWVALRGWAALAVFTNTINGLVPAPNSVTPGSLFLRDDGQWAQVQVVGIVDAFKFITDGTNTAIGSGPDTFRLRSSTNKIGITVTNNEAVFGDNANFTVLEAAVDHNALLNYVADQHIAHSSITLTAGLGISGGGTIAASRTFDFAPSELTANAAPVLTDYCVMDLAAGGPRRTLFSAINGILNHNSLLNYVADQHIAHTGVSIVAGAGLSGGGDITTSRTLALDINGLTTDVLAVGDFFVYYDISDGNHNKVSLFLLNGALDHNGLLNYVADQHVAHSSVSITGTGALTGGGTIAANRTIDVASNGITNAKLATMAAFTFKGNNTSGTAAPTDVDIHALTLKATPASTDEVMISDQAASGAWKRVTVLSLAGASGVSSIAGNTGAFTLGAGLTNSVNVLKVSAGHLPGEPSNGTASAGEVGEYIFSSIPFASQVTLTSGVNANVTSISLTAGDWIVWGNVCANPAGTTMTQAIYAAISTTSASLGTAPNNGALGLTYPAQTAGTGGYLFAGMCTLSLSATTTVYLVAMSQFTTSTSAAAGFIGARRIR